MGKSTCINLSDWIHCETWKTSVLLGVHRPYFPWCPYLVAPLAHTLSWWVPLLWSSWCWSRPRCRRECRAAPTRWRAAHSRRRSWHLGAEIKYAHRVRWRPRLTQETSVALVRTDSKELDASIAQALCRWYDIVLRLPVCDEDPNLGYTNPGARFRPEAVLQDISQRETWREAS